jgi:hypothetical protein
MKAFLIFAIALLISGCSNNCVKVEQIQTGMTVDQVKQLAGNMRIIGKTPETATYRCELVPPPRGLGLIKLKEPYLLTFDKSNTLIAFELDQAEVMRRDARRNSHDGPRYIQPDYSGGYYVH